MAIKYDEKKRIFTLSTDSTSYQMKVDKYGYLLHLYYGKKVDGDTDYLIQYYDRSFSGNPDAAGGERTFSLDVMPQEYSCYGNGDYRITPFSMKDKDGVYGCNLKFLKYEISKGKYSLPGLPSAFSDDDDSQTLRIDLMDDAAGVKIRLLYGVIESADAITRAVVIENIGQRDITITRAFSASFDWLYGDRDLIEFDGRHGMERNISRNHISSGSKSFGSRRGTSSHQYNPFFVIADTDANEDYGSCYGISLMYSGSFRCEVELDQFKQTRAVIGIQDDMFEYTLEKDEKLYTPEVLCCYSAGGFAKMSQNMQELIKEHVMRSRFKHIENPVLVNSWEGSFFDFDSKSLLKLAKQSADLGIGMFVLDDGWFGARNNDEAGLGDWVVNEKKLGCSLHDLVCEINKLGMKFGLWIEPEMVNEDSNLFRTHPDWAFKIPGRSFTRGRDQLVLDFSRKEIVDDIFSQISKVIDSANIEYIKMDMNRSIMDVFSTKGQQNNGAILYKYMLGVYDFMERLIERYPNILIEGCSGGGGRFDAGMLYYTPQIWCSDDTDAIERLKIQYGTSFCYPISAAGAHVSVIPNQQTGRRVSLKTRGVVAMSGTFGYELDICLLSDEEKREVREQVKDYHEYWSLIHEGKFYRLKSPMGDSEFAAWQFVSKDSSEALLNIVTMDTHCNPPLEYIKMKGLDETAEYVLDETDELYKGSVLTNAGFPVPWVPDEYQSFQIHFRKKN